MARWDSGFHFDSGVRFDEPDVVTPAAVNIMDQNLISQTMSDVQRDALVAHFTGFDTDFTNFKVALTPENAKKLSTIKPTDLALLQSALTFAQQNPGAIPADINIAEFVKDIGTAVNCTVVNAEAAQKADMTKTTLMALLSDGFGTARRIYKVAQAQGRTPQNQTFLDTFGQRFAHGPATPPPTP